MSQFATLFVDKNIPLENLDPLSKHKEASTFNSKKLLFLIPIIFGLGLLFVSSIGGVGLFSHSSPEWLAHMTDTIKNTCSDKTFWVMLAIGGVGGLAAIGGSLYGMFKKDDASKTYGEIKISETKVPIIKTDENKPPENQPPGYSPPGYPPPGYPPPGNQPLGNQPLGNQPLGNQPLGNQPLGNQPPGNQPLGNQPPGDQNQPAGNQPIGNQPAAIKSKDAKILEALPDERYTFDLCIDDLGTRLTLYAKDAKNKVLLFKPNLTRKEFDDEVVVLKENNPNCAFVAKCDLILQN